MRAAIAGAACVLAALAGCSSGAGSSAHVATDQEAITAAGAKDCVPRKDMALVRGEYDCADGLTVTTFASSVVREAMASVTTSSGLGHVVKQADNWMLTADN